MLRTAFAGVLLLLVSTTAAAQGTAPPLSVEPLPWVVVDVRGGWPAIGDDALTAADLGVNPADLPQRALTGVMGIHGYPLRRGFWKVGVGGELLLGRGRFQRKNADGEPVGDEINRTLKSVSWQLSLNFGRGQGWSYVTVGSGQFYLDSFLGQGPGDASSRTTLNAGAGARWFRWRHVGLNADLRFYMTKGADRGILSASRGDRRIAVISLGATFK